jgi:hypothetical protein
MKHFYVALIFGVLITLSSCDYHESEEALINGYYVGWIDIEPNRNIYIKDSIDPSFSQGIISDYVYSVGFDDRYILAKRLPRAGDKEFKTFYILDT